MKKIITSILFFTLIYSKSFAQVGIGTTTPAGQLDITSTEYGLLIPRVALTATNVTAPVKNPQGTGVALATSTMVYNTATSGTSPNNVVPGYYYWNGTIWIAFSSTDNNGWKLTGNSGTVAGTNFIGTTDIQDVVFKRNKIQSGLIGTSNTSFGLNALNPATAVTGTKNTAIGIDALNDNNSGFYNTAVGHQALQINKGGQKNTATGFQALNNNINLLLNVFCYNNTANGYQALQTNSGDNNTANGCEALQTNSGFTNTANGYQALKSNSGSSNTATGMTALKSNKGNFNTANGASSLTVNEGSNNTASGYGSLHNNTSGSNNTANGYGSLNSNKIGHNNTATGVSALMKNDSGTYNIATGNSAMELNEGGSYNIATGIQALRLNNGNYNTAVGYKAGYFITTGSNNIAIGNYAQVPTIDADDQLSIGNLIYGTGVGTSGAGNIGIGVTAPNSKMQIGGSLSLPIRSVSSGAINDSDYTIIAGGGTITLPTAIDMKGRIYVINRSSATSVIVAAASGQNLKRGENVASSYTLDTTGGVYGITVQSDGTNWQIIAINN